MRGPGSAWDPREIFPYEGMLVVGRGILWSVRSVTPSAEVLEVPFSLVYYHLCVAAVTVADRRTKEPKIMPHCFRGSNPSWWNGPFHVIADQAVGSKAGGRQG